MWRNCIWSKYIVQFWLTHLKNVIAETEKGKPKVRASSLEGETIEFESF